MKTALLMFLAWVGAAQALTVPLSGTDPLAGLNAAKVHAPYRPIERVEGPAGNAIRLDGYSMHLSGDLPGPIETPATLSIAAAVWSYPVTRAGLFEINGDHGRLSLIINQWGFLVATWETENTRLQAKSTHPLSRLDWHRISLRLDKGLTMTVNEDVAARNPTDGLPATQISGRLTVGLDTQAGTSREGYPLGVFNGALADLRIGEPSPERRAEAPPFGAPTQRFAGQAIRPQIRAMPPAGWTNEPHTLTRIDGRWHVFYQANPNGPWWDHMQWGHLSSPDLVTWHAHETALVPSPGFDRAGAWVGVLVPSDDGLQAVYTGVNGQWAGVGLAQASGPSLKRLNKLPPSPVIQRHPKGYQAIRDPFLMKRDEDWLMLIGSGTLAPRAPEILTYASADLRNWTYEGPLQMGRVERLGEFWELPRLLPIEDKWMLSVTPVRPGHAARTFYWLGQWDGARFVPDSPTPQELDLFPTHIGQTLASDGPDRLAGFGVVPGTHRSMQERQAAGWVHGFALARAYTLCDGGGRLCQTPQPAVADLFETQHEIDSLSVASDPVRIGPADDGITVGRVILQIDPKDAREITLSVRASPDLKEATRIRFFPQARRMSLDYSQSSTLAHARKDVLWADWHHDGGPFEITLYLDNSFIDLFTDSGDASALRSFPSRPDATGIFLQASDGTATLTSAAISTPK